MVFVYDNESFNRSKGSHKVVRKLYGLKEFIPDLDLFIRRLNSDQGLIGRLNSIQTFDYVTARYGSAFEVFRSDLPLVEDMFELYWILSEHLHKLDFE